MKFKKNTYVHIYVFLHKTKYIFKCATTVAVVIQKNIFFYVIIILRSICFSIDDVKKLNWNVDVTSSMHSNKYDESSVYCKEIEMALMEF